MSVFQQMGHQSFNLVIEENLKDFDGIVWSPVNYSESETTAKIITVPEQFKKVFDPQLYFPKSNRQKLHTWNYFPSDFDSADQTNLQWWKNINDKLLDTCVSKEFDFLCSPNSVPSSFDKDYYKFYIEIGNYLFAKANVEGIGFYQTAIIDYNNIKEESAPETIASILTQTESNSIYLIIKAEINPRYELPNVEALLGIMKLIKLLVNSGIEVFIAYCSTDFILWKYAGAKSFGTGKFFNLRRFSSSRFDEPTVGGGQLPYWLERNLLAYLREGDVIRLQKSGMLHSDYLQNPYSVQIINQLKNQPGRAWLGLSWKNYLYSFAFLDSISSNKDYIKELLKIADENWLSLEDNNTLMEEPRNTGTWVRPWRIAINEFDKLYP